MEPQDKIISLANVLYKNRIRLIVLGLVTFVVSAAITLTMPNYYKSETIFYPTSEDLLKPDVIFGETDADMRFYGTDIELDRLLSIAESPQLYEFLIEQFNLSERYGIEEGSRQWRTRLRNRLDKNYEVRKTRRGAVELSVEDTDPEMAMEMARAARGKISDLAASIIRKAQAEMLEVIQRTVGEKEGMVVNLKDSLRTLREKYGIFSVEAQSEMYSSIITELESRLQRERVRYDRLASNPSISRDTIAFMEANLMGLEQQFRFLTGEATDELTGLQRFNEGVGQFELVKNRFERESNQLTFERIRMKKIIAAYEAPYSAVFVVQEAFPSDEKSRPARSLIVGGAVLGVLLFSTVGLLLFHSIDPELVERIKKG